MCYICGDLSLTSPKHQEAVIHSLDDNELTHTLAKIKSHARNLERFPLEDSEGAPEAAGQLRKLLLGLIGESLSRFKAR